MAQAHEWYRDEKTGEYVHDVSVWVNAPVAVCFSHWAQFEEFPKIMRHIQRVERTGPETWHWEANLDGQHVEWDATMPEFRENEIITWRAVEGVRNSGSVNFIPEGNGCRISVHVTYDPPYGLLGDLVAQMRTNQTFHDDLVEDLNNFKQMVEAQQGGQQRPAA